MRMVLVFTPYRNNLPYSKDVFAQYEKTFDKWQRAYKQGLYELQLNNIESAELNKNDIDQFVEYMNQDLNVQNVMMLIEQIVKELNMAIVEDDESLGEGFRIGHSFFCNLNEDNIVEELDYIVEYEIIPLLKEYWFDEQSNVEAWSNDLKNL